ncbi:hypothetical protein OCK74_02180 [Chitinophagaceae bacterium LB-8]|uniref:Uncharacterized protein n=1 Tax=Paraflavisolibacter caeni TaxID=2982496 RepID=A0A9X3BEX4_9BACT|nr:hypothetical protein [Paraflavisolibacter caeni]MCU7547899.1 hypothetical protein [Paraflavisolibacter caeni]
MLRITFVITLELLCFIVNNETQHEVKSPCLVPVSEQKSVKDQKVKRAKQFYPLTFGSSFIILDEKLVCYE